MGLLIKVAIYFTIYYKKTEDLTGGSCLVMKVTPIVPEDTPLWKLGTGKIEEAPRIYCY